MKQEDLAAQVRAFHDDADQAAEKSRELALGLLESSADPFSRRQFTPGHITCTGLVLNPRRDAILLVHHRRLDRWLLPGGHVEADDRDGAETARREVIEETGVLLRNDAPPPRLIGVDVHGIPSNGREPYHLHYDLAFLFEAAGEAISHSPEARAAVWRRLDELDRDDVPPNVRRAARRALRG